MKIAIPTVVAVVLASGASGALAQARTANDPQQIVAMEAAWAKAAVARDGAALNRIVAPDWHGQNHMGKFTDRATMVHATVAGHERLTSMNNHDVHVRFLGADYAIAQGMDDESGVMAGKKVNEVYSWTDVYAKRGGHWVAVASQSTKIK